KVCELTRIAASKRNVRGKVGSQSANEAPQPVPRPHTPTRTAERGESGRSEYVRGLALLTGQDGERQDAAAAFLWFERGARLGSDLSAYALASLYELGEGAPRDPVLAAAWFRVAVTKFPTGTEERRTAVDDLARLDKSLT